MLIPLYLLEKQVLDKPCFYISDFFERNRDAYYDALSRVRTHNDISHWIKFFLEACIYTAKTAKEKFKKARILVDDYKMQLNLFTGKALNNSIILESFFNSPSQSTKEIQAKTGISIPAINRTLSQMEERGMIVEITGYTRNRVFFASEYINIFSVNNENT